ncbi:hypothetical protein J4468_04605 [Candidatus Woesearchaeota archaeon]|nr:hypothetical protein [Candidatus Woesearchaeota archaeon]
MILTKLVPYNDIKKQLDKKNKIGIVSCNSCAKICGTGGEKEMVKLSERLKKEKYSVVDTDLIGAPCMINQLKKDELKGDTTIVLACVSGIYNLKKIFPKKKIIPGLKTIGLAAIDKNNKPRLIKRLED